MMKKIKTPVLLLLLLTISSCIRNTVFPEEINEVDTINVQREENIAIICSSTSKTWAISQATLNTGSSQLDITNNYNVKDDEFIFTRSGETGTFEWKKRYDINLQATNMQETLSQRYTTSYSSDFVYAAESATSILTNSLELSFTLNDDSTLTATFTYGQATLQLTLVKKIYSMLTQPPMMLDFTNAFIIETDLIGAPGMIGSFADHSVLISIREDRLANTPGQSPERIIKLNLNDNSVSDYLYQQPGFASRPCLVVGDQVFVVGGIKTNVYDRLDLNAAPTSLEYPQGTVFSRHGTAVLSDDIFFIGGTLGNTPEAEENRRKILKFNINTHAFSEFATLPEPKSGARSAIVDDHLYVFGGSENYFGSIPTKTIYKVNLQDGSQIQTFEMNKEIDFTFVQEVEHLIYVAGSQLIRDANGITIGREPTVGVFDTMTNTYEEIPTNLMNTTGLETIHQMCILNNKMYIIYGDEDVDTSPSANFDIWNILVADLDEQ